MSNASKAALLVSKRVLTTPGRQTGRAIADIGINGLGQSAPDDKSRAARWRAIKKPAAGFPARALNSSDDEGGYAGDLPDVSNSTEVLAPVLIHPTRNIWKSAGNLQRKLGVES